MWLIATNQFKSTSLYSSFSSSVDY